MANQVNVEAIKTERSASYPFINLETAIKVITSARTFGRKITNVHIAGKGKPQGGGFTRKKAALSHFGLISGRGESLEITDLAESIIYPNNDEEKKSSLKIAFLQPTLFGKLYNETEKNIQINLEVLGNLLIRQCDILPSVKDTVLYSFIKSGIFAGLIEYGDQKKTSIILKELNSTKTETKKTDLLAGEKNELGEQASISTNELLKIPVTLSNGKKAILFLPEILESLDIKKLKAQIDLHANNFPEDKK